MKKLFLASSVDYVADDIANEIGKKNQRLLFVDTAAETDLGDRLWLKNHRKALVNAGFIVTDYTITGKTRDEVKNVLAEFDILYMSGGNGYYLLDQIQKTDCAEVLRSFVEQGNIYIGSSAGSYITAPTISPAFTPNNSKLASAMQGSEGLGLVDFFVFPHWGSDEFRNVYFDFRLQHAYNTDNKMLILTDRQYVQVRDDYYKIIEVDS